MFVYIIINYFIDFTIDYFQIAYIAIAYIYLAASIFILKDDFMKRQEEVEKIKNDLNEMEADYARIVADLSQQAKEKVNVETECDLIEQISLVA